ncbi:MAG: hypothetical protein ACKVW3_07570 [Phycisphaerales bacterium]
MADQAPNLLAKEMETFKALLPTLLDQAGQYAVIVGDELVGTYSTWADACKVGYQRVGLGKPFLVKKIEEIETANYFTRDLTFKCPT